MKKRFWVLFAVMVMMGSPYPDPWVPQADSKNLSQDEQLIWVGTGAFKDRLYDVAEMQFLQFLKNPPANRR